jgi:predicted N-formylglutamate amidohydrolase
LASHPRLFVTCEHGGNRVPERYGRLFLGHESLIQGQRGYDPGALDLARSLAHAFSAPIYAATTTRLLVDLNRSPDHRAIFSKLTRSLGRAEKAEIIDRYYRPHREAVESALARFLVRGETLLHIAVHTFTPVLRGATRKADIGLLYDPSRPLEAEFCIRWQQAFRRLAPGLHVRRNYPYLGTADGLATCMRSRFSPEAYLGIELEVNQRFPLGDQQSWHDMTRLVIRSLKIALTEEPDV